MEMDEMTVSSLEEKIAEMQENAQEATQALQAAQQRVVELQALLQRQTGALTALQQLQAERVAEGNGAISGEEAAAELEEISA